MIRHIRGRVTDIQPGSVVLDVAGVGYLLFVALPVSELKLDTEVLLHTYLAVRETAMDLYGFRTRDELEVFELLLTIPKIGPKSALQILSQADVTLLKNTVSAHDPVQLSKMSGISKKTAEKIVLGLADKFEDRYGIQSDAQWSGETAPAYTSDAIDALIALGYPQSEARKAVQGLPPHITNATEAVREALKELGKV